MKYKFHLIILVYLLLSNHLQSQVLNKEKPILMQVDRNIYISGDAVLFQVFLYHGLVTNDAPGPEVYFDLTDISGKWIDGVIVKHQNGIASGVLYLPDSLSAVNYYLRAYTQSPGINNYCYKLPIQVLNRFGKTKDVFINNSSFSNLDTNRLNIINLSKNNYTNREKVSISFNLDQINDNSLVYASLRVISKKQWINQANSTTQPVESYIDTNSTNQPYNGIIIHGTVTDGYTQKPIPNAIIIISCLDTLVRLKYDITDENGNFSFLVSEHYGLHQFYFNAFEYNDLSGIPKAVIKLWPQFSLNNSNSIVTKSNQLSITDSSEINKAIISKAYNNHALSFEEKPLKPSICYECDLVGNLTDSVYIDDFIALNSFAEISKEILPFIKIKNTAKGPFFQIIGNQGLAYDNPLVLVDGIPLTQFDKIVDWGSSKIKLVEVQKNQRFYGNLLISNGIIMIWTKKMDFWSQYSIPGTYSFSLMGFQRPFNINYIDYSINNDLLRPDLRQVLFWQSNLVFSNKHQPNIEFYTSDENGDFIIELLGVNDKGKIIKDYKEFTVK
jgi:hypothetical protein